MIDKTDLINGTFEMIGAVALSLNVFKLYQDKHIAGVHWGSTCFFAGWGLWNAIWYYPHLEQWFSWIGGLFLALTNLTWLMMLLYYTRRNHDREIS